MYLVTKNIGTSNMIVVAFITHYDYDNRQYLNTNKLYELFTYKFLSLVFCLHVISNSFQILAKLWFGKLEE